MRDILKDDAGFSLIELVAASVVGLLVLGAAYLMYETGMKGFAQVEGTTISSRSAAQCMTRIQRGLREATNISVADDYEIEFLSDPDDDGKRERVRFHLPPGTRNLTVETSDETATPSFTNTTTPVVVSSIVRNRDDAQPFFVYFTRDLAILTGAQRCNAGVVRLVVITQAQTPKPTAPYRIRTDVFRRNSGT